MREMLRNKIVAAVGRLARARRGTARPLPSAPRVLVLAYEDQLGSVMAATPFLGALRRLFPIAHITLAGTGLAADVLRHSPHVDRVVETVNPHRTRLGALISFAARVRWGEGDRYDLALSTSGCRRAAVGMLALIAPADRLGGHAPPDLMDHYDDPVPFDDGASMIANNLAVLTTFGGPTGEQDPELHFANSDLLRVQTLLHGHGLDPQDPLAVVVTQTSGGQPTGWFPERMALVADRLAAERGMAVVFVGTREGRDQIEAVRRRMDAPSLSLAGLTTVSELGALMASADLVVALDTGAMHVARAVRVPLVVVASAWQPAVTWLPPESDLRSVLSHRDLPCADCLKASCEHLSCMRAIDADMVVDAVESLLARHPPSMAGRAARVRACLHEVSDFHRTRTARIGT